MAINYHQLNAPIRVSYAIARLKTGVGDKGDKGTRRQGGQGDKEAGGVCLSISLISLISLISPSSPAPFPHKGCTIEK
ncbi:hypothetical protein H6G81_10495 [Scytonema hofmannii FACHB-248]|uniref:Uncharacterized protein n=1 Tax=Scytonema hofmannii FACHB-248 TaxID=1842502 RepID=A0ABR8GP77_9CYAN|nr:MULTISPECIES: hypothetical protein [Nostocales]MBD2604945.1 hypothetical protein [Scytonema hofmannii FACHB-248]